MTISSSIAQKALEYANDEQIVRFTQDFIRINSVIQILDQVKEKRKRWIFWEKQAGKLVYR